MEIVPIQECVSCTDGPLVVTVHSHSDARKSYDVLITEREKPSAYICECEGYTYRGHCRHQDEAEVLICEWSDLTGPEVQTPEQHKDQVCPRCNDDTRWVMEVIDETE